MLQRGGYRSEELIMRLILVAAFLAASIPPGGPARAEDQIEASTLDAIFVLATKGYNQPAVAEVRNVRKSLARNGRGYCGEVTIEGGGGFTVFHAILGEGTDASVLRLADYEPESSNNFAENVARLMHNFGCTD